MRFSLYARWLVYYRPGDLFIITGEEAIIAGWGSKDELE
jgi:hypothetical protein